MYICIHKHTYTHAHEYMNIYIHTEYIYIYICMYMDGSMKNLRARSRPSWCPSTCRHPRVWARRARVRGFVLLRKTVNRGFGGFRV